MQVFNTILRLQNETWTRYRNELHRVVALWHGRKGAVTSHIDGGVRIFGDGRHPKSGQSLAVARREARSARKRRDRYLRRRADLMKALAQSGLMPNDPDDRKELEKLEPLRSQSCWPQ